MISRSATRSEAERSERLLVVEDDDGLVHLMTRVLSRRGFVVGVASSAAAALEATSSEDFDLLLLDYQLPDMNGYDLVHELRDRGCPTPFIVITGHGDEKIAVEIMKEGARDYLVKDQSFLDRLPAVLQHTCRQIETERRLRETEIRLQRSEKSAQALLDATTEAALLIDRQGTILATNAILAARLRASVADLLGAHVFDRLTPSMSTLLRGKIDEAIRSSAMVRFEHEEGGRHLDTSIYPVLDVTGHIGDTAIYSQDITERRKLADQLRQAQKMEAIGQLAGGIAHDFNNILQVILGRSSLMEESIGSNGELARDLAEIRDSAKRAAALTRQLLAFSRRQVLQQENLNLNAVIEDVLNIVRRVIGEAIRLELFAAEGLGTIRADPSQIEQVLLNLCINARDAMPEGGRLVLETASLELDDDYCASHEGVVPGPHVQLSVSDTGIGMQPEVLEHIYEPFFTTKEVGKGTGLGLATVYGIVKQHKGNIHVYSEPGNGTVFKILFPVTRGSAATRRVEESGGRSSKEIQGGTETVLLAEDDRGVRRLAIRALERKGYTVLHARDGEQALGIFLEHAAEVSAAVLDVVLPRMSGPALRNELLRLKPGLPVLFTTGYSARAEQVSQLIDSGHGLLQKPYSPSDLVRRVGEVLDGT
jgi:signal transduction histidine kinase